MRQIATLALIVGFVVLLGVPSASAGGGRYLKFYHFYQWLRDSDGDGIPNCQDDNCVRPEDGSGYQNGGVTHNDPPDETKYRKSHRWQKSTGEAEQAGDLDRLRIRTQLKDCDL